MSIQKQNFPENPNIEIKSAGKTGLFTNYIFKAIPLAFDESLSYYEALCGLLSYLKNTIIPVVNNNADAVIELQKLYIELHDYVENYFDNLDVQEEINKKLDEMVKTGELQKIIINYLGKSYIINEITYEKHYNEEHKTNYYVIRVPNSDKNGNRIKLKHGFANDVETAQCKADETTSSFARNHNATLCVNASIFQNSNPEYENYMHIPGLIINEGHIISNYNYDGVDSTHNFLLGVKEDNSLVVYPNDTDSTIILNDGCYTTFSAFEERMKDGIILTTSEELYQWNLIGQNTTTKEIVFICCDGKNINDAEGMTQVELLNILKNDYNCDFAYRLDSGGSTSYVYNSVMVNQASDDLGQEERLVPDFIYFSKDLETIYDDNISSTNNTLGETNDLAKKAYQSSIYLNNIDTNTLKFNYPNKASSNTGLTFEYIKNKIPTISLVISPDNAPNTLNLYDNINNKTILRINPETADIITSIGTLANIFKINKTIEDLNSIIDTSIVRCDTSTLNSPDSSFQWIVATLRVENSGAIQIAIPVRQNQSLTPWKVRHRSTTEIGEWYTLVQPTN